MSFLYERIQQVFNLLLKTTSLVPSYLRIGEAFFAEISVWSPGPFFYLYLQKINVLDHSIKKHIEC